MGKDIVIGICYICTKYIYVRDEGFYAMSGKEMYHIKCYEENKEMIENG